MWEQKDSCASEHMASSATFQCTLQSLPLWKNGHAKYLSHAQIGIIEDKRSNLRKIQNILFVGNVLQIQKWRKYYNNRNTALGGALGRIDPLLNPKMVWGQPIAPLNAKKLFNIFP